jgi:hypothetical protein
MGDGTSKADMDQGALPAGALADRTGVYLAIALPGALLATILFGVRVFWPRVRRLASSSRSMRVKQRRNSYGIVKIGNDRSRAARPGWR